MKMNFKNITKLKLQKWIGISIVCIGIAAGVYFALHDEQEQIKKIEVHFLDSFQVFDKKQVLMITGLPFEESENINLPIKNIEAIEKKLSKNNWIEYVDAYVTQQILMLNIRFKKPCMKILTSENRVYYLNLKGDILESYPNTQFPLPLAIHVPIEKKDSMNKIWFQELASFGNYLVGDTAWNKKNYYIDILRDKKIELHTYNPTNTFYLGTIENYKSKLYKAHFFASYAQARALIFSRIDVQYKNQVLGIKN